MISNFYIMPQHHRKISIAKCNRLAWSSEMLAPFMRLHDITPQKLTFTFTATITSHLTRTGLELIVNIHKQPCPNLAIHVSRTVNCQDYIVLIVNKIWKCSNGRIALTKGTHTRVCPCGTFLAINPTWSWDQSWTSMMTSWWLNHPHHDSPQLMSCLLIPASYIKILSNFVWAHMYKDLVMKPNVRTTDTLHLTFNLQMYLYSSHRMHIKSWYK